MTLEICLWCIIRHPRHNNIKIDNIGQVWRSNFEGVFQFSVQEMLKDLSQNGKPIVLKPEQEAAIREQSIDSMSLQSIYQITVGDYMVTEVIDMSLHRYALKIWFKVSENNESLTFEEKGLKYFRKLQNMYHAIYCAPLELIDSVEPISTVCSFLSRYISQISHLCPPFSGFSS